MKGIDIRRGRQGKRMISKLAGPKDFWIGLIYIAFGGAGLYLGWDYKFGTAGRMGPGYFPLVLSTILVALGMLSLVRSVFIKGSEISEINWLPMILILLANASFGFLLPKMGAVVALSTMCLIAAIASEEFKFDIKASLGLLAISIACVVVFVNGLGVPMPVLGTWLEPTLGPVIYPVTGAIKGVFASIYNAVPFVMKIVVGGIGIAVFLYYSLRQEA
jgi:Tripartite tricarboxylate transporter TctB family